MKEKMELNVWYIRNPNYKEMYEYYHKRYGYSFLNGLWNGNVLPDRYVKLSDFIKIIYKI
jgi:hypothetical protein